MIGERVIWGFHVWKIEDECSGTLFLTRRYRNQLISASVWASHATPVHLQCVQS